MTTFNFGFECNVCQKVKNRQEDILNYKFDIHIVNNITSFYGCTSCIRMNKYEDIYGSEKYNKLSKIDKQIHCLFSFFDDNYQKLTKLNQKQKYFKHMMDELDDLDIGMKLLINEFLKQPYYIKMIEDFKICFLQDKREMFHAYGRLIQNEILTYEDKYYCSTFSIFQLVIENYLKHIVRFSTKYFDVDDIINSI